MKIKLSKSQWTNIGKKAGWMKVAGRYDAKYVKSNDPEVMEFISRRYMNIDDGYKFGENTARDVIKFLRGKGIPNQDIANEIQAMMDEWISRAGEAKFESQQLAGGWSAMTGDDI